MGGGSNFLGGLYPITSIVVGGNKKLGGPRSNVALPLHLFSLTTLREKCSTAPAPAPLLAITVILTAS